jgi:hypothetical protein
MSGAIPSLSCVPWRGQGQLWLFLNGMNELYVDGLLELRWIVELLEVRTRASVCSKVDRFYDSER